MHGRAGIPIKLSLIKKSMPFLLFLSALKGICQMEEVLFFFFLILKNLNDMMNSVGNSLPGAIILLIRALRLTLDHDSGKPFL